MWLYLDRVNDNFPGNELFIDYIAIGSKPDSTDASPCGLPDLVSGTHEAEWATGMRIFPNPTSGSVRVEIPALSGQRVDARLLDVTGRTLPLAFNRTGTGSLQLEMSALPRGVYFLSLRDAGGAGLMRRIVKR